MPQGSRGALVMYNPNKKWDTSPCLIVPGTPYRFGVIWHIDPLEEKIRLYYYHSHIPASLTEAEVAALGTEHFEACSYLSLSTETFTVDKHVDYILDNHFLADEIPMGKHALFFVNQLHRFSLESGLVPFSDEIVGRDGCYQCRTAQR